MVPLDGSAFRLDIVIALKGRSGVGRGIHPFLFRNALEIILVASVFT